VEENGFPLKRLLAAAYKAKVNNATASLLK
jgi:hypothetical protein